MAYKNCTKNGIWYYKNETKNFWTDFGECSITNMNNNLNYDLQLNKIRHHLLNFQIISDIGYSVSFISLVLAFFILAYVK